ncbi:UPF0235 protein C15orf40-like [Dendronephthya gigantea]|uniref:UPF0235 protein C15orf40-like n=1 Tax=Dendronephthya gigantea TaxID=151771 RepID=UPI00106DCE6A|nr:UPF0235 protein C15orf40-like [Dendronephthya gigantea]
MDMISLCRKRVNLDSPETKRRSPRIAQKTVTTAKKTVDVPSNGDKCFSNIDRSAPAISQSPNNGIVLRILAKPGEKESRITDITEYSIGLQIGAPAREIEANAELVNYLARVLQVRKTNIIVEKGLRSQIKSVLVNKNGMTVDRVRALIEKEMRKGAESFDLNI